LSTSGELIFKKFVKLDEQVGFYEKGYFGLPTPLEVSQDLMTQMPDRSGDLLQAMELEKYFHSDEVDHELDADLIDGHHLNLYLKKSFLEDCKYLHLTTLISICSF